MRKKISVIMSLILIGSTLSGCNNKNVVNKELQENQVNNLDFTFDVNPKNFEVNVMVNDKKETVSNPIQEREVSNLKKYEKEVSWSYPKENIDISIKKEKDYLDVAKNYKNYIIEKGEFKTLEEKAKDNKNIEKLYGAPHIYFWDKSIIAEDNIKWKSLKNNIPSNLGNWIKELLNTKIEDGKQAAQVFDTMKTQDYIDKLIKKGIDNLNKVELIELNKMLLKSQLKDSTTPTQNWAKTNTVDVLYDMKKSDIENAWIGFDDIEAGYVSPTLVDNAQKYGYLVGPYDSYHSIHKPGEEK